MDNIVLGIDISKLTLDIAFLCGNKIKTKKFNNSPSGFDELKKWVESKAMNRDTNAIHVCMEATGSYGAKLAQYLYDNNFMVSLVNPFRIKGFSMSKLSRVKTDKADCKLIAHFCKAMKPDLWKPVAKHIQKLKEWVNRLDSLIANKIQESNRLEGLDPEIAVDIQSHIDFIEERIKVVKERIADHIDQHQDLKEKNKLLSSIPGIGEKTISVILAFLGNVEDFESAKQMSAFVGLNPKPLQSGTSLCRTGKISKTGDAQLRKAFYMPAIVSLGCNPIINKFSQRLSDMGKPKMVVVIAVMRKLIHIIYGVLKNKTPFNAVIQTASIR